MTLPELSAKISGAIAGKVKPLLDGKQDKLAVTGAANKGVYVSASGIVSPMTYELNANVPANFAPATAAPLMDGAASVGTSAKYAREDHRHATDTSRAAANDVAALQAENAVFREYFSNMEVYRTASGNPAAFSDADAANVKALSVTITPTQSGSGDPSPDNVRPISGVSSVTVTRTGENGANAQSVTVSLTDGSNPLTVYGGTLDMTAGKLIVTHEKITLPSNLPDNARYFGGVSFDNILSYSALRLPGICTHTAIETRTSSTSGRAEYMWLGVNNRHIYWVNIMDVLNMSSIAEFNSWLAAQRLEVVYPLAAPVTYQLTPQQLATLAGYNAVSTDAESVAVEYRADVGLSLDALESNLTNALLSLGAGF